MKAKLQCPDCGGIWHVGNPGAGEMLCPSCMTRIPLDGSAAIVDEPLIPEPEACLPDSATDPTESARITLENAMAVPGPEIDLDMPTGNRRAIPVATALAGATVPVAVPVVGPKPTENEVVCPGCSLRFDPDQSATTRDRIPQTVLVVDDLVYFREIAKDALEPMFEVKTAATGAEARDILAKGGIDLLVLDLTLDGGQAGRDLLAGLKPKPCPILIFTANDESEMYGETWEELRGLGADDLVLKGINVEESLKRKVSALLGLSVDDGESMG